MIKKSKRKTKIKNTDTKDAIIEMYEPSDDTVVYRLSDERRRIVEKDGFATGTQVGEHCEYDTFTRLSLQERRKHSKNADLRLALDDSEWVEIDSYGVPCDKELSILEDWDDEWNVYTQHVIETMISRGWIGEVDEFVKWW